MTEDYEKPLADHEIKRSNVLTGIAVILAGLFLPVLFIPDKEPEEKSEPVPLSSPIQAAQSPDTLDSFGTYDQKSSTLDLSAFDSVKNFILNYTVFGFIFKNVEPGKVANSFKDLHQKTAPIRNRAAEQTQQKDAPRPQKPIP